MATRFYFNLDTAAPVTPPAVLAGWGHSQGTTRKMETTADNSTLTNLAYTPDSADHITNTDACHRRYVSNALAAQTLSGNVTAQFMGTEPRASNNQFLALAVRVISNDGTTVQNELLGITRDTLEFTTGAAANRSFPSTAMGSFACAAGDRLLIELGTGGSVTAAGGSPDGHNATIRWGTNASSGDLPVDDTTTGATFRPWVEFSNTFSFAGANAVSIDAVAVGVAALTTLNIWARTLAVTAVGVSALTKQLLYLRTLASVAVGIATLTTVSTYFRDLAATAVGVVTLTTGLVFNKTLDAIAVGVAGLTKVLSFPVTLAATAVGVAVLDKIATYMLTLAATAVGVVTLTRGVLYNLTLAAVAVGIAALDRVATFLRTLAVVAVGVASLTTALAFNITIAAVTIGVAVLTKALSFLQTLAAVSVGVADLTTQFIAGAGGAVTSALSVVVQFVRHRRH